MCNSLRYELLDTLTVDWLDRVFNSETNNLISEWNRHYTKYNILFSNQSEDRKCVEECLESLFGEKEEEIVLISKCLDRLFFPLKYMQIPFKREMCQEDLLNFAITDICTYRAPCTDLNEKSNAVLDMFYKHSALSRSLETIFEDWKKIQESDNTKKSYGAYSWIPLERKIKHLELNGDEVEGIPEPPDSDLNNAPTSDIWRVYKVENRIVTTRSSDTSQMNVGYFCELLRDHLDFDVAYIQHLLLTSTETKGEIFNKWMQKIERLPTCPNNGSWKYWIITMVEYISNVNYDNPKLDNILQNLEIIRERIFSDPMDGTVNISDISPELLLEKLEQQEIEKLSQLLIEFNNVIKGIENGWENLNIFNWISYGLVYDVYRSEMSLFHRTDAHENILSVMATKFSKRFETVQLLPFKFSPMFVMAYLASNVPALSVIPSFSCTSNTLTSTCNLQSLRNDYISHKNYAHHIPIISGAKLEQLIQDVIYCVKNGKDPSHHRELLSQLKRKTESKMTRYYLRDIYSTIKTEMHQGNDFVFLCALLVCLCKSHSAGQPIYLPPFVQEKPPLTLHGMVAPFDQTAIHVHPILLHGQHMKTKIYPLLMKSKVNNQVLVHLNEEAKKMINIRKNRGQLWNKNTFMKGVTGLLSLNTISMFDKVELIYYYLNYFGSGVYQPVSKEKGWETTENIEALQKMINFVANDMPSC